MCSESSNFALELSSRGRAGIALLQQVGFPCFSPDIIYIICNNIHVNFPVLKYVLDHIQESDRCSFINVEDEASVFHVLANTFKNKLLGKQQRKRQKGKYLAIINLLLDHGANPNLRSYVYYGADAKTAAEIFADMEDDR